MLIYRIYFLSTFQLPALSYIGLYSFYNSSYRKSWCSQSMESDATAWSIADRGKEYCSIVSAWTLASAQLVVSIYCPSYHALYYCSSYPTLFHVVFYSKISMSLKHKERRGALVRTKRPLYLEQRVLHSGLINICQLTLSTDSVNRCCFLGHWLPG